MTWSVVESSLYANRLWEPANFPIEDADGVYVFRLPLGPSGAMPLVSLEALAQYTNLSEGLKLGIAIAHITGAEIAAALELSLERRHDMKISLYRCHLTS
jgi:hypothetical protein